MFHSSHRAKSMSTPVLAATHKQMKGESVCHTLKVHPSVLLMPWANGPKLWLVQARRRKEKGSLCLRLRWRGRRFWKRWRKRLRFWQTTAGSDSAAAATAFTRNPSILGSLWRGGCTVVWPSRVPLRFRQLLLYFPAVFPWSRCSLCRVESLDNLDTLRQSSPSSAALSFPRPHSAAAGYCAPSRNSSSRYSTGTILSHRTASMDSSHHARCVICAHCLVCASVAGCFFVCCFCVLFHISYSGLTLFTCAAPGWSVAGGLAVCVSVPWVVGQPWS